MSDQLAVMNEGRIEQVGSPEDVYLRPRTAFVAGFLGAVNWIGGIGVRPEATRIARSGGARGCVPGRVTGSVFLGDRVEVQVRLVSGEDVVAQVARSTGVFQAGDEVHICWDAGEEMRFS